MRGDAGEAFAWTSAIDHSDREVKCCLLIEIVTNKKGEKEYIVSKKVSRQPHDSWVISQIFLNSPIGDTDADPKDYKEFLIKSKY